MLAQDTFLKEAEVLMG